MAAFLNGIIAIQPFPTADNRYVRTESGMVSSYIIKLWLYKTCKRVGKICMVELGD